MRFYEAQTLEELADVPLEYASAVAFSPDGMLVALGSWEQGVVCPLETLIPPLTPNS